MWSCPSVVWNLQLGSANGCSRLFWNTCTSCQLSFRCFWWHLKPWMAWVPNICKNTSSHTLVYDLQIKFFWWFLNLMWSTVQVLVAGHSLKWIHTYGINYPSIPQPYLLSTGSWRCTSLSSGAGVVLRFTVELGIRVFFVCFLLLLLPAIFYCKFNWWISFCFYNVKFGAIFSPLYIFCSGIFEWRRYINYILLE